MFFVSSVVASSAARFVVPARARRLAFVSLLGLAGLVVVNCGGSSGKSAGQTENAPASGDALDTTSGSAPSPDFCTTACNRVISCGGTGDGTTCILMCQNEATKTLSRTRADVLAGIDSCVQQASCSDVLGDNYLGACVDMATAEVGPSAAATAFCQSYAAAEEPCGFRVSEASCLGFAKTFADAPLQQATACGKQACGAIDDCVDAVLDVPADETDVDAGT